MPSHNPMVGSPPGAYSNPSSGFPQTQVPTSITQGAIVIDGTPLRVVTLVGLAVATVVALRWGGFKFHVVAGV